ncbi:hypothetical protein IVB18_48145 [Bradyrhizobium sp. 186]|uniref:hypothetical protein n=1 Tax=Bradyrhizobium sp. 186 TaxID=2782654 RepID=UPI00200184BB|nr:hypothetical protein [Bradyrhizobium sp. 186]UPK35624.1 hypothetical protein IVB18_48145 [Bradyrhizobium sp. 186]
MTADDRSPNQVLQMLDAADFDLPCPTATTVELVRKTVLGEAGIPPAFRRAHNRNSGAARGMMTNYQHIPTGT